jgi:flagellar basal-body rod modification protein FlgD
MDFSAVLTSTDQAKLQMQVDAINSSLGQGSASKSVLDKNDFLKILITQLSHQDPTEPMEDKEFVAQMAQFSALEQMTNMSQEFSKLTALLASGQAVSLLGKTVEIVDGDRLVTGVVEEVTGKEFPQVLVGGRYYDYSHVQTIKE